jgi:5-hydroxyisourate hydrolase/2-oxo-4-hydroxy-4-carboxy-5-ureidoimidazoline decarboxylase
LEALAAGNRAYEEQFGYIFIVCATGKSAAEMLGLLEARLPNDPDSELRIAMGEQAKITAIRLNKLLDQPSSPQDKSQITTHVLDTSLGRPAGGMHIDLYEQAGKSWQALAQGMTDVDGRISDLLPPARILSPGTYKLRFHSGAYFDANRIKGFYPQVEITFSLSDESHYHVPLLINPFGYSTYRGS